MDPLTAAKAEDLLADAALVPAMAGSIPDMKKLRDRCLAAGIPALVGCPSPGKSCGAKTHLLVREADVGPLGALLRDEWKDQLAREGLAPVTIAMPSEGEDLPCPACGTAAALVDGACSDCGLQLE